MTKITHDELEALTKPLAERFMAAAEAVNALEKELAALAGQLGIPYDIGLADVRYGDIRGRAVTARKTFAAIRYAEARRKVSRMYNDLVGAIGSAHHDAFDAIVAIAEDKEVCNA